MVKLAKAGKRVVRLKGGDPMIFGRAGEEIAACRAANIPVEVVPGISAAQGAASRLLVSLTHRAQARRLQYVTGHDRDGKLPADIDWRALADPAATTIVYMPKKTLRELSARAIAQGLDPATPAVAVANATRPDETIVAGDDRGHRGEDRSRCARRPGAGDDRTRSCVGHRAGKQQRRIERARRIAICVSPKREAAVSARQHTRPVPAASVNARLTAREGTLKRPRRR